jgi:hypothetical protein
MSELVQTLPDPGRLPDPRPGRRQPAAGRRRHVRRRAEAALGAAHPGRRAEPHPAGHALPAGGDARCPGPHRQRRRQQGGREVPDIYGIDNAPSDPRDMPRASRTRCGQRASRDDVDIVVDTHLHFDHAGGNTRRHARRRGHCLSFPRRATSCSAASGSGRTCATSGSRPATCRTTSTRSWRRAGFELVEGDVEVVPGISLLRTPGHTPHHQSVLVRSAGETACFPADVIPTSAHLPLPWIMGYDVEPLVTLETQAGAAGAGAGRGVAAGLRARPGPAVGPAGPDARPADAGADG